MSNVDHPNHYQGTGMECIDSMLLSFGPDATIIFCLMNAYKYIWRSDKKNGEEDIAKAKWYLNRAELINKEYNRWPVGFDIDFISVMKNLIENIEHREVYEQASSVMNSSDACLSNLEQRRDTDDNKRRNNNKTT